MDAFAIAARLALLASMMIIFALIVGVAATSRIAPAQWWAKHPWHGYWSAMGIMMIGGALYSIGLSVSAIVISLIAVVVIFASAIWGLRVTWYRSRARALVIFVVVIVLVIASSIVRWLGSGRPIRDLDHEVLGVAIVVVFWGVSAFLADHVYARIMARRMPATSK